MLMKTEESFSEMKINEMAKTNQPAKARRR